MALTGSVPLASLRQLLAYRGDAMAERCEVCGSSLPDRHRHLVDAGARRLVCACDGCVEQRQLMPMSSRYLRRPSIPREEWDALDIPVNPVFVFVNSAAGRPVACYPGPAGAVESALSLEAWGVLATTHPWIQSLAPDVEAVLVRRVDGDDQFFVIPIDKCYELAGRIRRAWRGINGGDEVRAVMEQFFADLDALSGESS